MTRYEAIFRRKSVRKYRKEEVDEAILEKIRNFGPDTVGVRPDIPVKWRIYKGSDHKVKGLFQVKAPYYAALYSEVCGDGQINGGCLMEQLVLFKDTVEFLKARDVEVVASMVGEILTVQEAGGFQMNIAKWDEEFIRLWNTPCHNPAYSRV